LGAEGRQPYINRLNTRQNPTESDLTDHEKELLIRIRQPVYERMYMPDNGLLLRTCYDNTLAGSDANFHGIISTANTALAKSLVLNDASLYDFGSNWERVSTRMPQLLERRFVSAQAYRQRVQQALGDARKRDEEERQNRGTLTPPSILYNGYHWAAQIGSLFVIDERTVSFTGPDAGKILVVWFDDRGREVRSRRQDPIMASGTLGLIYGGYVRDHDVWIRAQVGRDYVLENPVE
jgi:hypothetical protein